MAEPRTYTINLEEFDAERYPGGWAKIRERLSWRERQRMDSGGILVGVNARTQTVEVRDVDLVERAVVRFEVALVAWSLPLPADRTALDDPELPNDLASWLAAKFVDYYAGLERTPEQRKNSVGRSTAPLNDQALPPIPTS